MNRHAIARGDTHVWVSAEIVLGDLLVEGRSSAKRMKQTTADTKRLKLVAIDELHLCAEDSWGGGFRKAIGQLRSLHVRMSAGFDPQLQPIQTSVYRSDVFPCMLPTDNPTDIFRKILYTAMEESRDGEVPKMIFFVHDTLNTIDLRDNVVRWLQRWNKPSSIMRTIENQTPPQTIEQITTQQIPREHDVETIRQPIERFSLPPFTEYRESENLYDSDPDRGDTARHSVVRFAPQDQLIPPSRPNVLTTSIIPSTPEYGSPCSSTYDIMRQATVRHEYPVALNQSEAVPTNHTEPRRSKRDGKGQWHSKRLNEEQAEQLQKEEQRRLEKRENRVQKMGGALRLLPILETPRPAPGQYPRTPTPQHCVVALASFQKIELRAVAGLVVHRPISQFSCAFYTALSSSPIKLQSSQVPITVGSEKNLLIQHYDITSIFITLIDGDP
ncbi:hypothetical protein V8E54_005178 [Elaphomyces granulatus]